MCRFCEDSGNGGGKIIITHGKRQTMMPLCVSCNIKLQAHGISVCQNCGSAHLNNGGMYVVNYSDHCDQCRYRKIPFVFRNGDNQTA